MSSQEAVEGSSPTSELVEKTQKLSVNDKKRSEFRNDKKDQKISETTKNGQNPKDHSVLRMFHSNHFALKIV